MLQEEVVIGILREGRIDVVLDFSFWNRDGRDECRELVEGEGGGLRSDILTLRKWPTSSYRSCLSLPALTSSMVWFCRRVS
jgi:hypothetical protein